MESRLKINSNANLRQEGTSVQRGEAYVKRYLDPSDYEWDEQIQVILKNQALDSTQKSTAIENRVKELFNAIPDDQVQIKESQWDGPQIDQRDISKLIEEYERDSEFTEQQTVSSKQSRLVIGTEKEEWFIFNRDGQKTSGPFPTELAVDNRLMELKKEFPGEETNGLYTGTKAGRGKL